MPSKLALINKIGVIFLTHRRRLQKELIPYQITLKQYYVLRQLSNKGCLNPSEIADLLYCDRPTATVIIKNMEKQGWIKKEKDPEDGKQIKVTLAEEGLKKLIGLEKKFAPLQKRHDPAACLNGDEQEQLDVLLTKLWNYLKTN